MVKAIIGAAVPIIIVLSLLILFGPGLVNKNPAQIGPITLKYWGFEDEAVVKPLIDEYQKANPNVKVEYTRQAPTNYRTRVQTQIRGGVGPDVFKIHNTWTKMFTGDLAPAPKDIFNLTEYQNNFFPVASDSFVDNGKIYGVPDAIDGLALYYNEDILKAAGLNVPKTWQEFIDAAVQVTVKDPVTGAIQTAGAALGTTSNIDHWSDLLGLLLVI